MSRTWTAALGGIGLGAIVALGPGAGAAGAAVPPPHVHLLRLLQAAAPGAHGYLGLPVNLPVPLQYNGGLVEQAASVNYAIFWEPTGSFVSSTFNSLVSRYFSDVGGSGFYGLTTQYYQTVSGTTQHVVNASRLGGSWVDTAGYPSSSLTDTQIQAEVTRAIGVNGWTVGVGHQFFVFTAKGENSCDSSGSCSFSTYCAYHGNFVSGGQDVLYANMPYSGTNLSACGIPASPNHDADADSEINVISHEHIETVTDPNLDAWSDVTGSEIGDKCNFTFGPQAGDGSDVSLNGHPYLIQEEWSNAKRGCALS